MGPTPSVEDHASVVVFGHLRRRLASFHGKATYFGTSSAPLQNHAPLNGRIIVVKKPVTIHIVSSIAFFGELVKFREVRPLKVSCILHKVSFDIYIDYVLKMFEKHILRD